MTNKLLPILFLSLFGCALCFGLDPRFDYGPRVHVIGRPAQGSATAVKLGDTGYEAEFMISYYADESDKDPDFVTVSVNKVGSNESVVYFMRQFLVRDVPSHVLKFQTKDLMTYDEATRTVQFAVGDKVFKYILPEG